MATKEFKGVISDWTLDADGYMHGTCVVHATYGNGLAQGHRMTTSKVIRIFKFFGFSYVETKNSIYLLVD